MNICEDNYVRGRGRRGSGRSWGRSCGTRWCGRGGGGGGVAGGTGRGSGGLTGRDRGYCHTLHITISLSEPCEEEQRRSTHDSLAESTSNRLSCDRVSGIAGRNDAIGGAGDEVLALAKAAQIVREAVAQLGVRNTGVRASCPTDQ